MLTIPTETHKTKEIMMDVPYLPLKALKAFMKIKVLLLLWAS